MLQEDGRKVALPKGGERPDGVVAQNYDGLRQVDRAGSSLNGVTAVLVFCLVDNVEFIVFNEPSTYVFRGYADKSIVVFFNTSFINVVLTEIVFCLFANVEFIVFNGLPTFDLIAYTVKSGLFIIVRFQSL